MSYLHRFTIHAHKGFESNRPTNACAARCPRHHLSKILLRNRKKKYTALQPLAHFFGEMARPASFPSGVFRGRCLASGQTNYCLSCLIVYPSPALAEDEKRPVGRRRSVFLLRLVNALFLRRIVTRVIWTPILGDRPDVGRAYTCSLSLLFLK